LTSLLDETAVLKSTRDEEQARAAAPEAIAAQAPPASVATPPSNAAKPKTDAAETNPSITSPSPVTAAAAAEKSASVAAPAFDAANANKAAEQVENTAKQRKGRSRGAGSQPAGGPLAPPQEKPADDAASKPLSDVGTSDKASPGEINGKRQT
jgi:NADH-quinone oxidoreductase subunit E